MQNIIIRIHEYYENKKIKRCVGVKLSLKFACCCSKRKKIECLYFTIRIYQTTGK